MADLDTRRMVDNSILRLHTNIHPHHILLLKIRSTTTSSSLPMVNNRLMALLSTASHPTRIRQAAITHHRTSPIRDLLTGMAPRKNTSKYFTAR